jgi:intracellular septation protein A
VYSSSLSSAANDNVLMLLGYGSQLADATIMRNDNDIAAATAATAAAAAATAAAAAAKHETVDVLKVFVVGQIIEAGSFLLLQQWLLSQQWLLAPMAVCFFFFHFLLLLSQSIMLDPTGNELLRGQIAKPFQ